MLDNSDHHLLGPHTLFDIVCELFSHRRACFYGKVTTIELPHKEDE